MGISLRAFGLAFMACLLTASSASAGVPHVVQPGETLWGISTLHYGSGNLYYRLVAANPSTIPNPNLIHPGDIVRVPRD